MNLTPYIDTPRWNGIEIEPANYGALALERAGLDWEVKKTNLQLEDGTPVRGHWGIVRDSDKKTLGVVKSEYHAIQNITLANIIDETLRGTVTYETVGMVGSTVWMLANINDDVVLPSGDTIKQYLLATNPHDGNGRMKVLPTTIRVVCKNTLNLALRSAAADTTVRVSHVANWKAMVEEGRSVLARVEQIRARWNRQMEQLAVMQISDTVEERQIDSALDMIFGREVIEAISGDTVDQIVANMGQGQKAQRRAEARAAITGYLAKEHEIGGQTAWSVYNAIGSYLDHGYHNARTTSEGIFKSQVMGGKTATLKNEILDEIIKENRIN